jgi:hypothetical protein
MGPIMIAWIALTISAFAAEPPSLITATGEHVLADGLRLIVADRGDGTVRWTVARKFPDQTSSETAYSPLAATGEPFVFCWDLLAKRLWVASPEVVGYLSFVRLPTETPRDFSEQGNLIYGSTPVPADIVAQMPEHFRAAAAKWIRTATNSR